MLAPKGNALTERFIYTLKSELLGDQTFLTVEKPDDALEIWLVTDNKRG